MHIILNDPIPDDYKAFHELISEPDVQKEFSNYQGQTIEETKQEINYWVNNKKEAFPSFLRMIKITYSENAEHWERNNKLIGFISIMPAGAIDFSRSGFKMLMNFAISKEFEGKGIMTAAMKMTLDRLYELQYNIVSALVKPGNYGSQKVLEKCGFDLIRDYPIGKTYVKALKIDMDDYRSAFGL